MNRLYILLTVMVLMVGPFAAQEAVAKVLTGTGDDDRLVGTDRDDRLKGRGGDDRLDGGDGDDKIVGGGVDYIDCGAGFDRVETIHRDDRTKRNCERALGPRRAGG